jgi:glyoxylase-like metal-dependent hydrolase (beta-lactamase superfamily II)
VHNGKSYYFKIAAQQDGTFTITNMRNNFSKTYRPAWPTRPVNRVTSGGWLYDAKTRAGFDARVACLAAPALAQNRAARPLTIYVVDVEGGNGVLFVSPTGESLLMDTGNANAAAPRDAGRIMEAVRDAGLTQIDNLIITHWHGDHYRRPRRARQADSDQALLGSWAERAARQGPDDFLKNVYAELISKAQHTVAKPGDRIPLGATNVHVVCLAGMPIAR